MVPGYQQIIEMIPWGIVIDVLYNANLCIQSAASIEILKLYVLMLLFEAGFYLQTSFEDLMRLVFLFMMSWLQIRKIVEFRVNFRYHCRGMG